MGESTKGQAGPVSSMSVKRPVPAGSTSGGIWFRPLHRGLLVAGVVALFVRINSYDRWFGPSMLTGF